MSEGSFCFRCKSTEDVASTVLDPWRCFPLCASCRATRDQWFSEWYTCGQCGVEERAIISEIRPGWIVPPYPSLPDDAADDVADAANDAWLAAWRCPTCATADRTSSTPPQAQL